MEANTASSSSSGGAGMEIEAHTGSSSSSGAAGMGNELQQAATLGDSSEMEAMALGDPAVLLTTYGEGNTCLHIAAMKGHRQFCESVLSINGSLLAAVNENGQTPLVSAVLNNHESLACYLLLWCSYLGLSEAVLRRDKNGCNALHHAIRGGHRKVALELIGAVPALSEAVNKDNESPMFLALKSADFADVFDKLLKTPKSSNKGGYGHNALHARVSMRKGDSATTGRQEMDTDLMEAATSGNVDAMKLMDVLVLSAATTPVGNTCLHIASIHNHQAFCQAVLNIVGGYRSRLLAAVNDDGETPLLVAVTSGNISLAQFFLPHYRGDDLREAVMKQDKNQFNVLHHAIRSGHRALALDLIKEEPSLSHAVNIYGESPMFIAAMRDYPKDEVLVRNLLKIQSSAHVGAGGSNVLHAAVRNGNSGLAKTIITARPELAREEDFHKETPVHHAVRWGKVDVLGELLDHDRSLGYLVCSDGTPLLNIAATRGQVSAAQEILNRCPDTPYQHQHRGWTCLHEAVWCGQTEFLNFILKSKQLRKLVNMRDVHGKTALHVSVRKCMPQVLAALLRHKDIDVTVLTHRGYPASWSFDDAVKGAKSLQWNEVSMLLLNADPKRAAQIYNLHKEIKDKITDESRKNVKPLTETYTRNTSIVAILIASITFSAAFTLSGWYRSDAAGSQGLPIMAKKFAFQAFLISDTLAMCCSLSVAFICILARWEDFEFLLYYRSFTEKIMWFAYVATITAFATGLYTVLAPHLLPWAIAICCLPGLLPISTMLLGKWPVQKLQIRLGQSFKSDLLDMV